MESRAGIRAALGEIFLSHVGASDIILVERVETARFRGFTGSMKGVYRGNSGARNARSVHLERTARQVSRGVSGACSPDWMLLVVQRV